MSEIHTSSNSAVKATLRMSDNPALPAVCEPLNVATLNSLAVNSLNLSFDQRTELFCRSIALTSAGLHRTEPNWHGSVIALLGLNRLGDSERNLSFDINRIKESILQREIRIRTAGDLGLLIWFTADCLPDRLQGLRRKFDVEDALDYFSNPRHFQSNTYDLAWLLAGIAHARIASPQALPDLSDVAVNIYHSLRANQGESGIFGHSARSTSIRTPLCGLLGTFADQAFSIYALSAFARAFDIEEPLESALNCANMVCDLQGDLGQWWFLYHKSKGSVVSRYPVRALQQDGIAPFAFQALQKATSYSFDQAIQRGLSWVLGRNEFGYDFRDLGRGLIWDEIRSKSNHRICVDTAWNLLGVVSNPNIEDLKLTYECRPEHLGWLLYAFGNYGLRSKPAIGLGS